MKRWHKDSKRFLEHDHPLVVEADRKAAAEKAARDQAGYDYIADLCRRSAEAQRQRDREIIAWEEKHGRDWRGPR